jgi:hypothetical protein
VPTPGEFFNRLLSVQLIMRQPYAVPDKESRPNHREPECALNARRLSQRDKRHRVERLALRGVSAAFSGAIGFLDAWHANLSGCK